jgi:very-short-patch-repair endonuclease
MRPDQALERLGGIADAGVLVRLTSRAKVRRAVRRRVIVREARGRYSLPTADEGRRTANRLSGVASHLSAAAIWGWELAKPPELPQVIVPRNRKVARERRLGVDLTWADLRPGEVVGRVTAPDRTVMDCARELPFPEALAVADSALRHGNVTRRRLLQVAERVPPRYRARCRRVAQHADGRAANPFESVLRALAIDAGLEVAAQVVITMGTARARPDVVDASRRLVLEADSYEFHGKRAALLRDCERYNALVIHGWTVLRFGWEHVMLHPDYVLGCLRAMACAQPVGRAVPDRSCDIPA